MDTQTTPGPDRAEERRKQIMNAALTCFARKGYHKTQGHRQILTRVKISEIKV